MTTLIADDAMLIAYVEGQLSPRQREEVEQRVNESPEIANRVALLRASALPYDEIFTRQAVPPLPDSLVRSIDALIARHGTDTGARAARPTVRPRSETLLGRLFGQPRLGWLAVAFTTGAVCCGLMLQNNVIGSAFKFDGGLPANSVAQAQPAPWVRQAADYQRLYSRDTLNYVIPDAQAVRRTLDDIRQVDGLALQIPDLSAAGLTFKRVQRLSLDHRALIQLVYLTAEGEPVALCVMKENLPDQIAAHANVSGMGVVVWRKSDLSYALLGAPNGIDLDAIARLASDRSAEPLYTANTPSALWLADIHE